MKWRLRRKMQGKINYINFSRIWSKYFYFVTIIHSVTQPKITQPSWTLGPERALSLYTTVCYNI
jgi:hypothetical protein